MSPALQTTWVRTRSLIVRRAPHGTLVESSTLQMVLTIAFVALCFRLQPSRHSQVMAPLGARTGLALPPHSLDLAGLPSTLLFQCSMPQSKEASVFVLSSCRTRLWRLLRVVASRHTGTTSALARPSMGQFLSRVPHLEFSTHLITGIDASVSSPACPAPHLSTAPPARPSSVPPPSTAPLPRSTPSRVPAAAARRQARQSRRAAQRRPRPQ